jgi:hypothetical protein
VEVQGRFDPDKPDPAPEPITLPEPRLISDFVTAPCRHECNILKQVRHVKKAHIVLSALNPVKQALLRATAGQCGMDSASCSMDTVREVASLDYPGKGIAEEDSREASLFCAATLHRFGLPVDFARLKAETLPETCACCKAPLWDSAIPGSRMDMIFAWQCHLGRCGGDGRRLQAHEVVKKSMRDLVLSNTIPGGGCFSGIQHHHRAPSSTTGQIAAWRHLGSGQGCPQVGHGDGLGDRLSPDEIVLIFLLKKLRFRPQGSGTRQVWERSEVCESDLFLFYDEVCPFGSQPYGTAGTTLPSVAQGICLHPGHEAGGMLFAARTVRVDPLWGIKENPRYLGSTHHMDSATRACGPDP